MIEPVHAQRVSRVNQQFIKQALVAAHQASLHDAWATAFRRYKLIAQTLSLKLRMPRANLFVTPGMGHALVSSEQT
jgi:hypothetical protein